MATMTRPTRLHNDRSRAPMNVDLQGTIGTFQPTTQATPQSGTVNTEMAFSVGRPPRF